MSKIALIIFLAAFGISYWVPQLAIVAAIAAIVAAVAMAVEK